MKLIILGDLHLGARGGSEFFSSYFNRFFTDTLYPYMDENGIKTILQLGDLFDNRTSLTFKPYFDSKSIWFDEIERRGIDFVTLLGNHDSHYRNTLKINSPELLLSGYKNIHIVSDPEEFTFDGMKIDVIPWICAENRDRIHQFLSREDHASILLGHLELQGFPMSIGDVKLPECNIPRELEFYSMVLTGHFHTRSQKGNILYTGTPYEITWSDYGDPKGFHVLDTSTNKLEFVRNPESVHVKIIYDSGFGESIPETANKIVKLVVVNRGESATFERDLSRIRITNPYDLQVIENPTYFSDLIDESLDVTDTSTIIRNYVDSLDIPGVEDLKKYIMEVYNEALSEE